MLRISAAVAACGLLVACADNPRQYDLRKSIGPCIISFATEGDTWYAIPDRDAVDSNYVRGTYWALMTILVTTNGRGTSPVTVIAGPTDLRVVIPAFLPITSAAQGSCRAFDSAPALL